MKQSGNLNPNKETGTGCPATSKFGRTPPDKHDGVGRQQHYDVVVAVAVDADAAIVVAVTVDDNTDIVVAVDVDDVVVAVDGCGCCYCYYH